PHASRRELHHRFAVEVGGRPPADEDEPARVRLRTAGGKGGLEALALQLPEVGEGLDLAPGTLVQLAQRPGEGRIAQDGDDEDVGLDIPRLVGGHANLHCYPLAWWRNRAVGHGRV